MPPPTRSRSTAITAATTLVSTAALLGTLYYLEIPAFLRSRAKARKVEPRCYDPDAKPSLQELIILVTQTTSKSTYPLANRIEKNIPIYECGDFDLGNEGLVDRLQDELAHNLTIGPGVYVLKHFFVPTSTAIDTANRAFASIIASESAHSADDPNQEKGDHFAPAAANSRIWNSFSKHALTDPESFAAYFSNPWFRVVCDSYLGPAYKITTQVNIVRPGGQAQSPHRDYHLGFQLDRDVVAWPKAAHAMSAMLTLQGAVAHTDMPLESGPTRFLPWSQGFGEGYRAFRIPEFKEYFEQNYVAAALEKGDAVFFSPALFHAAGENRTETFERSANLVQVSSAFGKTMESIDTLPLIDATYDILRSKYEVEGMSRELDSLIRAVGEGYCFPTNLDCRPPGPGKMAPESEQEFLRRAISERWERERVIEELTRMRRDSSADGGVQRKTTVFGT